MLKDKRGVPRSVTGKVGIVTWLYYGDGEKGQPLYVGKKGRRRT